MNRPHEEMMDIDASATTFQIQEATDGVTGKSAVRIVLLVPVQLEDGTEERITVAFTFLTPARAAEAARSLSEAARHWAEVEPS